MFNLLDDTISWAEGRSFWMRFPLFIFMLYIAFNYVVDPGYTNIFFFAFTFSTHEPGHIIFSFFGEFMGALGGTLLQFIVPSIFLVMFKNRGEYDGVAFCLLLIAAGLFHTSIYMADAQALALPAAITGQAMDGRMHDWRFIFDTLGVTEYCFVIANIVKVLGYYFLIASVGLMSWLMYWLWGGKIPLSGTGRE